MKNSIFLKLVFALVLIVTFITMGAFNVWAAPEKFNWTLAVETQMGNYTNEVYAEGIERILERTNGNLDIKMRTCLELGYSGKEQLREVKKGSVQWAIVPEGYIQGDEPVIGLTWLPFLTPSWESGRAGYEAIKPLMNNVLQKKWNCRLMWMHPFPEIAVHTNKREIRTLDDFKGLKLRVPGGYWAQAVEAAGGVAVNIPMGDTYTALSRGTVDGVITSFQSLVENSWAESCPVSSRMPFVAVAGTLSFLNLDDWNSLPEDYQKIVLEECQKMEDELWLKSKSIDEEKHFPELEKYNHKFVVSDPELTKKWSKLCKPIWEKWIERGGETNQAIMEAYLKAVGISH